MGLSRRFVALLATVVAAGLVLLVVVVGLLLRGGGADDGSGDEIVRFDDDAGLLLVPTDGRPDLVGFQQRYTNDGSVEELVRADFAGRVEWATEREVEIGDQLLLATPDLAVMATRGRRLVAFDLTDGRQAWDIASPVETCISCARAVGDRLLVAGRSGDVTAIALTDGSTAWTHQGGTETRGVAPMVVDDSSVVVPQAGRDGDGADLVVLSVASGDEQRRFTPRCRYGDRVDTMAGFDTVVALPGTRDVAVVFGTERRCVQRWALDGEEPAWESVTADGGGGALAEAVATDETLAVAGDDVLLQVAVDDGSVDATALSRARLSDLLVVDDTVVGGASDEQRVPTGVTGVVLGSSSTWSHPGIEPGPAARVPRDGERSRATYDREDGVDVVIETSRGLRVLGLPPLDDEDPPSSISLGLVGLDARSGDEIDGVEDPRIKIGELDHPTGVQAAVHGQVDDLVALTVDSVPVLIDASSGDVVAQWPAR